jgi:dihydrofolate reductase
MGEILVHEFMSLDGVIDTPTWTAEFGFDPQMGETLASMTGGCTGILLGRTTYQMFAPAWSQRTADEDPGAPFFNETRKYVVSGTLADADATWNNSEVLGPYDADRIRQLKESVDGDLYVSGSGTLVRALVADGLADQLHLFCYPVTRGSGPRVFPDGVEGRFELAAADRYDNGVLHLDYRPAT